MDKIEKAREFFKLLEGREPDAAQVARRAFFIQEMMSNN